MIILMVILMIFSLFLDGLVPNLIREFIPFFFVCSLIISSSFEIDNKLYYIIIIIFGLIYDSIYSTSVIINTFSFVLIAYLSKLILKDKDFFKYLFTYYLMIILYTSIMLLITLPYIKHNYFVLLITLIKSAFINTMYFFILYLVFIGIKCLISHRFKKRSYF